MRDFDTETQDHVANMQRHRDHAEPSRYNRAKRAFDEALQSSRAEMSDAGLREVVRSANELLKCASGQGMRALRKHAFHEKRYALGVLHDRCNEGAEKDLLADALRQTDREQMHHDTKASWKSNPDVPIQRFDSDDVGTDWVSEISNNQWRGGATR